MNNYLRLGAAILAVSTISACATAPNKIQANYIPTAKYESLSCADLTAQLVDNDAQRLTLYNRIAKRNKSDKIVTGVGVVVAWPALFFLRGNGEVKENYANLLGTDAALTKVANDKGCTPIARTAPVYTPRPEKKKKHDKA